jgi:PAS domain S-box-containing protein
MSRSASLLGGAKDMSKPRLLLRSEPSAISRYAIAVLSVATAIVVAEILTTLLHTEPIASTMFCAVIFAAWFGFGPGLLAIVLSLLAIHYYLVPPINSFSFKHNLFTVEVAEVPRMILFSIAALFVNFVSLAQRRSQEAALQAEAKAARAEREIRLVTDTIPALVWSALPDGAVEYFNQPWLTYTGLTLEQARGWGFIDAYHPEDRTSVRTLTSIRIPHAASANDLKIEARLRGVDGKYRWFLSRAMALRDEAGNIIRWYGTSIDVEDRKRAEDALRRSEAYLAEAQHLSVTGSFGWRVASGDVVWSEETYRIFGLDRTIKPTINLVLQYVHPGDRELVRHEVNRVAEGKHDFNVEHRLLMPNGLVKYLHVRSRRVECESGDDEIVGAVMDITAARDSREALHAARAELAHVTRLTTVSEMGASIAHEVNQPLAGIVTNAEACLLWLDRKTPNLDKARHSVELGIGLFLSSLNTRGGLMPGRRRKFEAVSLCPVWLSQAETSHLSERLPYHHKSASETSGPQSASMRPKLVSAQRTRCDRGGKARNIREKCQSRKQEGAATGKTEFLAEGARFELTVRSPVHVQLSAAMTTQSERAAAKRRAHEAYRRERREEEARWFRGCLKALRSP